MTVNIVEIIVAARRAQAAPEMALPAETVSFNTKPLLGGCAALMLKLGMRLV
jgi:hypothetical protein